MKTSHDLAYKSLHNDRLLIFCMRTVSVEIGQIGLHRTLFTNFGCLEKLYNDSISFKQKPSQVNSPPDALFTSSQAFI